MSLFSAPNSSCSFSAGCQPNLPRPHDVQGAVQRPPEGLVPRPRCLLHVQHWSRLLPGNVTGSNLVSLFHLTTSCKIICNILQLLLLGGLNFGFTCLLNLLMLTCSLIIWLGYICFMQIDAHCYFSQAPCSTDKVRWLSKNFMSEKCPKESQCLILPFWPARACQFFMS